MSPLCQSPIVQYCCLDGRCNRNKLPSINKTNIFSSAADFRRNKSLKCLNILRFNFRKLYQRQCFYFNKNHKRDITFITDQIALKGSELFQSRRKRYFNTTFVWRRAETFFIENVIYTLPHILCKNLYLTFTRKKGLQFMFDYFTQCYNYHYY